MTDTTQNVPDFDTYLAGRGISRPEYERMPGEMRQYLLESWQFEHHVSPAPVLERLPEHAPGTDEATAPAGANGLPVSVLSACLVILVLVAGSLVVARAMRARSAATSGAPVQTALAPAAVAPEGRLDDPWIPVSRIAGSGTKRTAPFTVEGKKWRVVWATRPGAEGAADFLIRVLRADGSVVGPAAHTVGENEGETVLRGTGAYLLEASSRQNYFVRVYDYR